MIRFLLHVAAGAGSPAAKGQASPDFFYSLFPFLIIIVIFYFILIRPQQSKMKTHREFLTNLKRGDEVVTDGGIMGRVTGLTDKVAMLEIADNVRIRVMKDHIAGPKAVEEKPAK